MIKTQCLTLGKKINEIFSTNKSFAFNFFDRLSKAKVFTKAKKEMNSLNIFDDFFDGVIVTDKNGVVLYCNNSAATLTQLSEKKIKNKQLNELIKFEPQINYESGFQTEHNFIVVKNEINGSVVVTVKPIETTIAENCFLIIMKDISLEKNLHSKYQSQLQAHKKMADQAIQQKLELQILNTQLDRQLFQVHCLLDFHTQTRQLSDKREILFGFMDFVVERFMFCGALFFKKNKTENIYSIQHSDITVETGNLTNPISTTADWNIHDGLNLVAQPEVTIISSLPPLWHNFLQNINSSACEQMLYMKLNFEDGCDCFIIFTLPNTQQTLAENILQLLVTLKQHAETMLHYSQTKQLSLVDEMTGLYNQRHLKQSLNHEVEQAHAQNTPLSLLILDIDHFKKINDTYGHQMGDFVLKNIAEQIKQTIRTMDISFRYGGEEFLVLLPNTSPERALIVAERIRQNIENLTLKRDDVTVRVTISIGLSNCPDFALDGHKLIETADMALYEAKRSGRNKVNTFTPALA